MHPTSVALTQIAAYLVSHGLATCDQDGRVVLTEEGRRGLNSQLEEAQQEHENTEVEIDDTPTWADVERNPCAVNMDNPLANPGQGVITEQMLRDAGEVKPPVKPKRKKRKEIVKPGETKTYWWQERD